MKTKYIWVVTACAVLGGSHATSYSAVHGTTIASNPDELGRTIPDVLEVSSVDSNQIASISMMEIEVLNSAPEPLPSIPALDIGLLTDSESDTFSAAIQTQAIVTQPVTQNRLFAMASELAPSVPEPETWAMLLAGLGLIGLQLRRSQGGRMDIH